MKKQLFPVVLLLALPAFATISQDQSKAAWANTGATWGLAQPYSNMTQDAPPVAVSRMGGCELSLACLSVTAKLLRSCYIVPMPTNLHRCYGAV